MDLDNILGGEREIEEKQQGIINIYFQKRNTRKGWTLIEGINEKMDKDKLCNMLKKKFSCSCVVENGVIKMSTVNAFFMFYLF